MSCSDDRWISFVCAAISARVHTPEHCCVIADATEIEWQKRFGSSAQIIMGIRDCSTCGLPINGKAHEVINLGLEFHKVCIDCIEKKAKGDEVSNPGIATCVKCGQTKGTIFACPEEHQPIAYDGVRDLTDEERTILSAWRLKLAAGTGVEHTWKDESSVYLQYCVSLSGKR